MSLKAALKYIECRSKEREEDSLYRAILSEYIAVLGTGKSSEKYISYTQELQKLRGEYVEDKRTAEEILLDTIKKHNLTLKK